MIPERDRADAVVPDSPGAPDACAGCALVDRRSFLHGGVAAAIGALLALGAEPAQAAALRVVFATGVRRGADQLLTYPIPTADGATIDKENQVILVRFGGKAYCFNLACPHQNTALRWHPDDVQFECPKHHSKYRPDGTFISGRATRGMDRFPIKQDDGNLVVDVDQMIRQDKDPAGWAAAFVTL